MSIPRKITSFLHDHGAPYRQHTHPPAFTAQEIAHAQHTSGRLLAKTVMLWAGNELLMAVVPASHQIAMAELERLLGRPVRLAHEKEFRTVFPGCDVGAMPPLGNLYHLEVWVDEALRSCPTIHFNAGTHTDTIEMSFADFDKLVHPHVGCFAALAH